MSELISYYRMDPHVIIPMSEADMREIGHRAASGIQRFNAVKDPSSTRIHAGFINGGDYEKPLSRYQKWMRESIRPNDSVSYHYTAKFTHLITYSECSQWNISGHQLDPK